MLLATADGAEMETLRRTPDEFTPDLRLRCDMREFEQRTVSRFDRVLSHQALVVAVQKIDFDVAANLIASRFDLLVVQSQLFVADAL